MLKMGKSFYTAPGTQAEGDFNGLQLVAKTTGAPEPSTYALFGLGLAGLTILARRRLMA